MSAPAALKKYTKEEVALRDGGVTKRALQKQLETASADEKAAIEAKIAKAYDETWIIIHGVVFDVTKFKNKHPGGPGSFVETAGQDATTQFEELYHSASARDMLRDLTVGQLDTYEGDLERVYQFASSDEASQNVGIIVAVGVAIAAAIYYMYF
eukprot:UN02794